MVRKLKIQLGQTWHASHVREGVQLKSSNLQQCCEASQQLDFWEIVVFLVAFLGFNKFIRGFIKRSKGAQQLTLTQFESRTD